jgi:RNA polymerase sigma-70 factor, ECF subfamily
MQDLGAQTDLGTISPEQQLLAALRRGDEAVFAAWVDRHHGSLVRLAAHYVRDAAAAEEVAQEAWVAFIQSLERFEGRASLKTWLFRTLLNCARNRKRRDVHSVPFSAIFDPEESAGPTVDPSRFLDQGVWAGHWAAAPRSFAQDGEDRLLQAELRQRLLLALETLPPAQREVISLRDVEGFSAEEACDVLGLSEANQRVLLHRARARLRALIETYFTREGDAE